MLKGNVEWQYAAAMPKCEFAGQCCEVKVKLKDVLKGKAAGPKDDPDEEGNPDGGTHKGDQCCIGTAT